MCCLPDAHTITAVSEDRGKGLLGLIAMSNRVAKDLGTAVGTKCPVRMTVTKLRLPALRMCPMTFAAEGHGVFGARAKLSAPNHCMANNDFRLPM
mmetsp:Transcript_47360/g.83307  ORF Transcript_47360/g.83307 Transcript_47360/m.83307 type:complete len:95 (+) Transcript_47360:26-310(+)